MESRVDLLVKQSMALQGDPTGNPDNYSYGPSLCLKCKEPIKSEGQEVTGSALATEYGIVFRLKIRCKCGCSTGFVNIDPDELDGPEAA